MLRNALQIFRFFNAASEMAALGKNESKHEASWHKRIVRTSILFGITGAIAGLGFIFVGGAEMLHDEGPRLLLAPGLFAIGGILLGVAISCTFAPADFFRSEVGQQWMALIGTNNIALARMVCGTLALLPVLVVAAMAGIILLSP